MQQNIGVSLSGESYLAALASFFDRKGSEVMSGSQTHQPAVDGCHPNLSDS
jgi:hypothetical protein